MKELIAYSPETAVFSSDFITALKKAFPDKTYEIEMDAFGDKSPLVKVESADHVLYVTTLAGDNWKTAQADLSLNGSAFTMETGDIAGPNTTRLGVFFIYLESRKDRRDEKPLDDKGAEIAIVKNQGVSTITIARELAHVVGAKYVITNGLHSHLTAEQFRQEGLEHLNLTIAPVVAQEIHKKGFLTDSVPTMLGTADLGNLNHIMPLWNILKRTSPELELAIVTKRRVALGDGTKSEITQKLAYGDVKGKRIILFDDVGSSLGTLKQVAKIYFDAGARELVFFINHPVFVQDYYENATDLLWDDRISLIMAANTLQLGRRGERQVSAPYIKKNGQLQKIETLNVNNALIYCAGKILHAPTLAAARESLGDYIWDMKNPEDLYKEITGKEYEKPEVVGIYHRGEIFSADPTPDASTPASST